MNMKVKELCAAIVAGTLICTSFPVNILAGGSIELSELAPEDLEYSDDLTFISYGDLEELRQWNRELGYFDEQQEAEIKEFIEQNIAKGVTDDYEKAQLIFKWINRNVEYAHFINQAPWIDPWDVFTKKVAVCGGYSNLYKAMLSAVDIPSVLISGDTYGGAHVWNAVYADERWFYSDATWGEGYFDKGTKSFLTDHTPFKVQALTLETEDGILLGYDHGLAVVGVTNGSKEVSTPLKFRDMYVTSIGIGLYDSRYGVEKIHVGSYVDTIDTQGTSNTLEAFVVAQDNPFFSSRDGVLFSKDMKSLLIYPMNKQEHTFVLPKETTSLNIKDVFANAYLENMEVEEGSISYTSYEGCLYDAEQTKLLMVPAGKTDVFVKKNAAIDDMAFANVDINKVTIHAESGSPAQEYAQMYGIRFVDIFSCNCENTEDEITKATTIEDGQIVIRCKECKKIKETKELAAVNIVELSQTDYIYDGKVKHPEVTVKDRDGKIVAKEHYDIRYADGCINPGTYEVLVTLKGDYYSGTLTASYEIEKSANPFIDVKEQDYFYDAVLWAAANKITSGYSAEVFAPHATCTRAEVVTFLWRERGYPEPKSDVNPFVDIEEDAFYYKAVLWAAEEGITKGVSEQLFAPNDTVTRGQFVSLLHRAEGNQEYAIANPFEDVKKDTYYYDAILWAYENRIAAGYQNNVFAPEMGCTRCQVVSFLYRNKMDEKVVSEH